MENHEKTLTESISDAKMEFERLQALLSEKEAEMKREEILKKHTTPITFLEGRGRWTTRVNGKQKTLKSRKELEDWIVSQYSETATAKTLDDIAEAWFSIDEKRSTDRTLVKHRGWYERFLKNSPLFTKNIQDITIYDLLFIHLSAHDQKILHKCKKRIKWHYAVCYRQTFIDL